MDLIAISTATPPYRDQLWCAPLMVPSLMAVPGNGRGQKSVFSTTGQVDVDPMADHERGTTRVRVPAIKEAALPRGVPR